MRLASVLLCVSLNLNNSLLSSIYVTLLVMKKLVSVTCVPFAGFAEGHGARANTSLTIEFHMIQEIREAQRKSLTQIER